MSQHTSASAKGRIPQKKKPSAQPVQKKNQIADFLEKRPWIYVILLFLVVSILYIPVAFEKRVPPPTSATDTFQWQGAAHRLLEYNKTHHDKALWQPNMFSGMPSYLISLPNQYPFVENITRVVDHVMNWRIFLLFIGGLGVFLLLRNLGLDNFLSFFGAIAFIFSCHWTGLLAIGHNTKFRAVMWMPWVMWAIMILRNKPNLLGLGLSSVFLIAQLRENHLQISYYLYLFIGMFWIYWLIETFSSKEWKKFGIFTLLLLCAFGITALAVMNPYLSTEEYSHYTIRGGAEGLDKAYAQGWSFPPAEIIAFFIPDFFGGINQTYWGGMEFTQIYNYCGILIIVLAMFALLGKRKKLGGFLWIASLLFLIMSFGKYAGALSDFLLKYFPYYNKFRVPSMMLVIFQFNMALLAALGLEAITEKAQADDKKFQKHFQTFFIITAVVFLLFVIAGKGIFKGLPFTNAKEIQYLKQNNAYDQLPGLKELRLGMLYKSGVISLLILTAGMGLIFLFLKKKAAKTVMYVGILILAFIDLWLYTGKNLQNTEPASYTQDYFTKRDYDEYLLSDKDNYRIFPLNIGVAGQWAYYHQTIEGYHGAKLKRYQEVLENCLYAMLRENKINWNLLNMLSVKYVIFSDSLPFFNLEPVFSSNDEQVVVHRNLTALPRAWFVDSVKVIKEPKKIWGEINSERFNPASTAIVEEEVKDVQSPSVKKVTPDKFDLHYLSFVTETDKPAFLTVSEIYYPAGWKAYIDGKETPIYATNYILRGVVVPAGKHTVEMKFAPASYSLSIKLSLIGILLAWAALIGGLVLWYLQRKKRIQHAQG